MSSCLNICDGFGIVDNLIGFFNTDDSKSWVDFSDEFNLRSLKNWDEHNVKKTNLLDYGLTMFDVGRSNKMFSDYRQILEDDIYPKLYPVRYNNITGGTELDIYNITGGTYEWMKRDISGSTRILCLDGGYLQNYFKLDGYDFQQLPYRYLDGYTFNTRLFIEDDNFFGNYSGNTGYFLFLGTRAENKYSKDICEEKFIKTNENQLDLGSDHEDVLEKGIKGNVLGFFINENANIGIRYIDDNCNLQEKISCNKLNSGWQSIDIVFYPYDKLDKEGIDCVERRNGLLRVFVNGFLFWELDNFPEIWLTALETEPEKQIGVPFNLSWGGGSFGLKHSLRFFESESLKYNMNVLSGNTLENFTSDNSIRYDSISGVTRVVKNITSDTLFSTVELPIKSDHHYNVKVGLRINNVFRSEDVFNRITSTLDIKFRNLNYTNISGICELEPILDNTYINIEREYISGTTMNYVTLNKFIRSEKNCELVNDFIDVQLEGLHGLGLIFDIEEFSVDEYFYDFDCVGNDLCQSGTTNVIFDCNDNMSLETTISGDCSNIYQYNCDLQNLPIEKYFDGSFIGCLHKLRIYDRPLNLQEIRANYDLDESEIGNSCKTNRIII